MNNTSYYGAQARHYMLEHKRERWHAKAQHVSIIYALSHWANRGDISIGEIGIGLKGWNTRDRSQDRLSFIKIARYKAQLVFIVKYIDFTNFKSSSPNISSKSFKIRRGNGKVNQ